MFILKDSLIYETIFLTKIYVFTVSEIQKVGVVLWYIFFGDDGVKNFYSDTAFLFRRCKLDIWLRIQDFYRIKLLHLIQWSKYYRPSILQCVYKIKQHLKNETPERFNFEEIVSIRSKRYDFRSTNGDDLVSKT